MSNIQSTYQPQEIEVWYVIPAIRKEIAKELKNLGKNQTEISLILGITKAAVSQYFNDKRGKNIELSKKIELKIKNSAKQISKNPEELTTEIQKIIQEIRKSGLLCKYHKEYSNIKNGCNVCIC